MITIKLKQDVWIGGVKQLAESNISVEESFAASLISENKAYVPKGWNVWPNTGGIVNFSSLYQKLSQAYISAINNNPFDLISKLGVQPLVSAVTLNAAAYTNAQNFLTTGANAAFDKCRKLGVPYKDQTAFSDDGSNIRNPSGLGAGLYGLAYSQNRRGSDFVVAKFTGQSIQFTMPSFPYQYYALWVNGIPVAPAASYSAGLPVTPVASGTTCTNIQIDFAAVGTYEVMIGYEQSAAISGISVNAQDTVYSLEKRLPIVVYGDSYIQGTTSGQGALAGTLGMSNGLGMSLCGAISAIGGLNAIGCGMDSSGYVNPAGVSMAFTQSQRLNHLVAAINNSGSQLVAILGGYNDTAYTTAQVQAAATTVINHLLANTTANIVLFGSMPGRRNNSAAVISTDLGISNAVTTANNNRVAFIQTNSSSVADAWVVGTNHCGSITGGVNGNSRYITGPDTTHLSSFILNIPPVGWPNVNPTSGVEYIARKIIASLHSVALTNQW
ncbi:MAG: hypothetical protein WBC07_08500 [Methylotenera sp.]